MPPRTAPGYLRRSTQPDVDIKTDISLEHRRHRRRHLRVRRRPAVSNGNDYRLKVRYQPGGSVVAYLATPSATPRPCGVDQRYRPHRHPATCSGCASRPSATARPRCGPRSGAPPPRSPPRAAVRPPSALRPCRKPRASVVLPVVLSGVVDRRCPTLSVDNLTSGRRSFGPPVNVPADRVVLLGLAVPDGLVRRQRIDRRRRRHDPSSTRGTSATAPPVPASRRTTRTRLTGDYSVTLTVTDNGGR